MQDTRGRGLAPAARRRGPPGFAYLRTLLRSRSVRPDLSEYVGGALLRLCAGRERCARGRQGCPVPPQPPQGEAGGGGSARQGGAMAVSTGPAPAKLCILPKQLPCKGLHLAKTTGPSASDRPHPHLAGASLSRSRGQPTRASHRASHATCSPDSLFGRLESCQRTDGLFPACFHVPWPRIAAPRSLTIGCGETAGGKRLKKKKRKHLDPSLEAHQRSVGARLPDSTPPRSQSGAGLNVADPLLLCPSFRNPICHWLPSTRACSNETQATCARIAWQRARARGARHAGREHPS